jgi:hypothetical protein
MVTFSIFIVQFSTLRRLSTAGDIAREQGWDDFRLLTKVRTSLFVAFLGFEYGTTKGTEGGKRNERES